MREHRPCANRPVGPRLWSAHSIPCAGRMTPGSTGAGGGAGDQSCRGQGEAGLQAGRGAEAVRLKVQGAWAAAADRRCVQCVRVFATDRSRAMMASIGRIKSILHDGTRQRDKVPITVTRGRCGPAKTTSSIPAPRRDITAAWALDGHWGPPGLGQNRPIPAGELCRVSCPLAHPRRSRRPAPCLNEAAQGLRPGRGAALRQRRTGAEEAANAIRRCRPR